MKNSRITSAVLATMLLAFSSLSYATVLTFDELTGSGAMPDPYMGIIDWEDGVWFYYDGVQDPYYPSSGATRTYESTTDTTPSWDFLSDVVYNGSYFSGYDYASVQMDLYLNGSLVHSTGAFAPSATPTFFDTGYGGLVDRVVINTSNPDFWVMDDLTYNASVPEPGTMILLATGLLPLVLRKKFKLG